MHAKMIRGGLALAMLSLLLPIAVKGEPALWTPVQLSTEAYESSPAFTPDGREMFFMRADTRFQNYQLLWSRCERGGWSSPTPPPFAMPLPILEGDPFVTENGQRVYFISSRHAAAQGRGNDDLDIWYADRLPSGTWSAIANRLPEPVNSVESELLPRLTRDGSLYFGSSRSGGKGGSDIYLAKQAADGSWTVSAVDELNTANNEYEADVTLDGKTLVLVADRGDRSHLYLYTRPNLSSRWVEQYRLPALPSVFQVGPRLSPSGDRVLFAQSYGQRSGELFLLDLKSAPKKSWPPKCPR
jgi:Tol biopolymer transport system component